jgi:CHAD domain-containing protein
VAVKRINTIYKLKKHIAFPVTINDKLFEVISAIYRNSGKLRDIQLQQTLLYHYRKELKFGFIELQDFLNKTETKLEELLIKIVAEIDVESLAEATNGSASPEGLQNYTGLESESALFILKKIEKIEKLILLLDNEDFVHDLRKQVKQLFFVLQFLCTHFPDSIFGKYDLKPLQKIGDRLGKWNDITMFQEQIRSFTHMHDAEQNYPEVEYYLLGKVMEADKFMLIRTLDVTIYLELAGLKVLFMSSEMETPTAL